MSSKLKVEIISLEKESTFNEAQNVLPVEGSRTIVGWRVQWWLCKVARSSERKKCRVCEIYFVKKYRNPKWRNKKNVELVQRSKFWFVTWLRPASGPKTAAVVALGGTQGQPCSRLNHLDDYDDYDDCDDCDDKAAGSDTVGTSDPDLRRKFQ